MTNRLLALKPYNLTIATMVIYGLSLAAPVFRRDADVQETIYGLEILLTGSLQTLFSGPGIKQSLFAPGIELSELYLYLALAFPWLANPFIIAGLILARTKTPRKARIPAVLALFCMLIFWFKPLTMIGPELSVVPIHPLVGAYLWSTSGLLLLWLSFIKDNSTPPYELSKHNDTSH